MDELSGYHQQVIERQQQRFAQLYDHDFLGRGEGRLQAVRRVRAIGNPVTALPAANGILTRVVPLDNFMIYKDIIRLDRPD